MVLVFIAQILNIGDQNATVKMFYHIRKFISYPYKSLSLRDNNAKSLAV